MGGWGLTCQNEPKPKIYTLVVAVIVIVATIVITDVIVIISPSHVVCSHGNNFKDVVFKICLKEFQKIVLCIKLSFCNHK